MKLDVYLIRGRGEDGSKFQLAMVRNDEGHYFKGEYDPTQQFASFDELVDLLAELTKHDRQELEITELNL